MPIFSPGLIPAITAADGTYCLQGTQATAETIYAGGYVEITAIKVGLAFTTGAGVFQTAHTWGYDTSTTGTQIDLGVFISHLWCSSFFMSTCGFNFVAS